MKQVLKLTKSNKNVLDQSLNKNELIFNSEFNTFKIIKKIYTVFSVATGNNIYTVQHLLNYIPLTTGFIKVSGTSEAICPNEFFDNIFLLDIGLMSITADQTKISFELQNNTLSTQTIETVCFIFESPL